MTSGLKKLSILAVCIVFAAGAFLTSCARGDQQNGPDADELVGQVDLPPLDSDSKSVARAEAAENQTTRRSTKPLPDNINTELPDFTKYKDSETKKKEFFNFLRPIIRKENQRVLKERAYVLARWQEFQEGKKPEPEQKERLNEIAEKYRVKTEYSDGTSFFRNLLIHVDKIPVDLALIQAAKESAWGTSYFAREGNNLFGQWCFKQGCGLVPRRRPEGATYEVQRFDDVEDSVRTYIRNLNSHPAYNDLRIERYRMRLAGGQPDGHYMAGGLEKYSEIGMQYVKTVRQMIRGNQRFMGIHDATDNT